MKEKFKTAKDCLARIAEIDAVMGFPDSTGTLTYATPEINEETGEYEIEVSEDLEDILNIQRNDTNISIAETV